MDSKGGFFNGASQFRRAAVTIVIQPPWNCRLRRGQSRLILAAQPVYIRKNDDKTMNQTLISAPLRRLVRSLPRLAFLCLLAAGAPLTVGASIEHVVVIGCDGMGSLAFTETNAPVMRRLMREGAWTLRARGVMPTSSSPNWASMIMGAGPEQHGVTSNEWETNKFDIAPTVVGTGGMFPTIFGALRAQRPTARILCVHDWDGFGRLMERSAVDVLENVKGSPATAQRAVELVKERKPNFLFIHFDDVDHAGHKFGWKTPEYFEAVEMIDGLIGQVLASLDEAGIRKQTLVLVTADHGGVEKKHGGTTMAELEIPWIIAGPGVRVGHQIQSAVNTYDTAATLAMVFGIKPPESWIARPVREAFIE